LGSSLITASIVCWTKADVLYKDSEIKGFLEKHQKSINIGCIIGILLFGFFYLALFWGFLLFLVGLFSAWLGWSLVCFF
jgi:hypothetical protein